MTRKQIDNELILLRAMLNAEGAQVRFMGGKGRDRFSVTLPFDRIPGARAALQARIEVLEGLISERFL